MTRNVNIADLMEALYGPEGIITETTDLIHSQPIRSLLFKSAPSGVYFIYRDGELIYIGQTKDLQKRLQEHRHRFLPTDVLSFRRINDARERLETENICIILNRPKQNIRPFGRVKTQVGECLKPWQQE